jgi:hypothetical protein
MLYADVEVVAVVARVVVVVVVVVVVAGVRLAGLRRCCLAVLFSKVWWRRLSEVRWIRKGHLLG